MLCSNAPDRSFYFFSLSRFPVDLMNMMIDVTGHHGCQLSCQELGGSFAPETNGMMVCVLLLYIMSLLWYFWCNGAVNMCLSRFIYAIKPKPQNWLHTETYCCVLVVYIQGYLRETSYWIRITLEIMSDAVYLCYFAVNMRLIHQFDTDNSHSIMKIYFQKHFVWVMFVFGIKQQNVVNFGYVLHVCMCIECMKIYVRCIHNYVNMNIHAYIRVHIIDWWIQILILYVYIFICKHIYIYMYVSTPRPQN